MTIESSSQEANVLSTKAAAKSVSSEVNQFRALYKAAKSEYEAALSNLKLSKTNLDRYTNLYKKGSATKADFDNYTNAYNQASAKLKVAKENLKAQELMLKAKESQYNQAKEEVKQAVIQHDYFTIRAPYDGYIGVINPSYGEYVTPATLLTTISQTETLDLKVGIDSANKDKLKKDLTVRIVNDSGETLREGKIWFIAPKIDPDTQTILTKTIIENEDGKFKDDQVVKVKVVWYNTMGIKIPSEATLNYAGQDYIFKIEKSKKGTIAKQIPVKLGGVQGNRIIVKKGLKEGDVIVVSGIQKLRDGTPVSIQK